MRAEAEIAVVGAGAAGLMAAIWAARGGAEVVLLDSARHPGAKILVAGGGRCNATHDVVNETAFAGSSRTAIRNVLGRLPVPETIEFFKSLGVVLKREATGKLFPTTDDVHTVLDALLRAVRSAGAELLHPWRVESIDGGPEGFVLGRTGDEPARMHARRVILATGGRSLPKTGSDGHGYSIARSLGHSVTETFPGLVPLTLPEGHFLRALSGVTLDATIELRAAEGAGRRLTSFTGSILFTHFGLSGPAVLDISRYWLAEHGRAGLVVNFLPRLTPEEFDTRLAEAGRREGSMTASRFLSTMLPERLARALCAHAGVDAGAGLAGLSRESRRALVQAVTALPLPVTGTRGYNFAEVTAGGVPLSEVRLETMESRVCPGLYLCGEILDVDGRIGGYNFQWAWASGFVAGTAAAAAGERGSTPRVSA